MPLSDPDTDLLVRLGLTLQKPDTLLLLGAGVSQASALPSWDALIFELAEFRAARGLPNDAMLRAAESGDLLLAASYGVAQLPPEDFGRFLCRACRHGDAEPNNVHRLILQLGPTCIATTNYDQLIEAAFARFGKAPPRVVVNSDILNLQDIVQASATNFLFKYHGDIERPDTVVLAREHYRRFFSSLRHIHLALELLLATRPVVMIGFGLRDPDFLLIKDRLSATFGGGFGEHYAIVPDVHLEASRFWEENYGVELVGYRTIGEANGRVSHAALEQLLTSLIPQDTAFRLSLSSSETLRRLGRYGNRIAKQQKNEDPLPLSVHAISSRFPTSLARILQSHENLTLIGRPGAGKSYALLSYVSSQAALLVEACLHDRDPEAILADGLLVPFLVDLALYQGDLNAVLQQQLPTGLPLREVMNAFHTVVVLDGVNELPERYLEAGAFRQDFERFSSAFPQARFILAGRQGGWADAIPFPQYEIENIPAANVIGHFGRRYGVDLGRRPALVATLQTPLFFRLADREIDKFDAIEIPNDVHRAFFERVTAKWRAQSLSEIDVARTLANISFVMVSEGREYFLVDEFDAACTASGADREASEQLLRFLLGEAIIDATSERRLSVFHQSATEYLASTALVERAVADIEIVRACLTNRRWDEPIFLALASFPAHQTTRLFEQITSADLVAGMRAVHHLRERQSESVLELLASMTPEAATRAQTADYTFAETFWDLPFDASHVAELERLACSDEVIGGLAGSALARLCPALRPGLIDRMARSTSNWNYAEHFARGVRAIATSAELRRCLEIASECTIEDSDFAVLGRAFENIDHDERLKVCREFVHAEGAALILVSSVAGRWRTTDELWRSACFGEEIAKSGIPEVVAGFSNMISNLLLRDIVPLAERNLGEMLADAVRSQAKWSSNVAHVLIELTLASESWRELAAQLPLDPTFEKALAFWHEQDAELKSRRFDELVELIPAMSDVRLSSIFSQDLFKAIDGAAIDKLIETRHPTVLAKLALRLFNTLGEYRDPEWWIEMIELFEQDGSRDANQFIANFSNSRRSDPGFRAALKRRLNERGEAPGLLLNRVALYAGLSTDDLPENLVDQLIETMPYDYSRSVLGGMASEALVVSRIIPLWQAAPSGSPERERLSCALAAAEQRHGRRYMLAK